MKTVKFETAFFKFAHASRFNNVPSKSNTTAFIICFNLHLLILRQSHHISALYSIFKNGLWIMPY